MGGKTDLSSYNNDWYKPGSKLKRALWFGFNTMIMINPFIPSSGLRKMVLRLFGAKVGKGVVIKPRVSVKYPWLLTVGDHVWIGEKVWIDNLAQVTIDDHVCISQGAMLLCGNHNYKKKTFDLIVRPITLEEGAWVGAQSVVCPGVVCKTHTVLSVNSVATTHLEAYQIYMGNPAVSIKERKVEG